MSATLISLVTSNLQYSWDPETSLVHFTITVPNNNYFSIGFGPTMYNTDMILWQATGETSEVTDLWSTSHAKPLADK